MGVRFRLSNRMSDDDDKKKKIAENLKKFDKIVEEVHGDLTKKKKKKKKDRRHEESEDSYSRKRSAENNAEPEVADKKKKKKKSKTKEKEFEEAPTQEPEPASEPAPEPVKISAADVANMATDAFKEQEEKNLKDMKTNLGQYTGATLEGGSARLDKFARLLGGKKKESKGLFGRKPVPAPGQRAGHSNVVNGNDLNQRLEDQFYRAKGYHNQNFRGFHQ